MPQKPKAVLIYGGQSTEHEVSRRSAAYIWKNIDRQKFDAYAIAIDKEGRWHAQNRQELERSHPTEMPLHAHDKADAESAAVLKKIWTQGADNSDLVVFEIVHGTTGEDGMMQGFFDLQRIAYVGPGILGSSVAMDKVVAKQLVEYAGVPVVPYVALRLHEWLERKADILEEARRKLKFPMFVKPASLGSSVGINRVENEAALEKAVQHALEFDDRVLIETGVNAREIEYACLGGYAPKLTAPGEIGVPTGFYTYEEKYSSGSKAEVLVPAPLASDLAEKGRALSRRIFEALNLYGLARIDLFLDKTTNEFYFNEANTLPGMTAISQYPKLWEHEGLTGTELISRLLETALERRKIQVSLKRSI
ncbi:D-alanine--D-alanine ligase family protein [Oligoflexus tunisiensis]|uniref:D-alanine--D-alanine ligase family protein n=1 Tax=Oligoflexus tunisiensis TaxID=708132 RepID=UPI000A980B7B|nr:D-alanine--D-alanine ligase family protein [Oligoflexus tunisiensis]